MRRTSSIQFREPIFAALRSGSEEARVSLETPMNVFKASILAGTIFIGSALACQAGFGDFEIPGTGIRVVPTNPVHPVQAPPVKVGPVVITPNPGGVVPTPPDIRAKGNGEIAKAVNTANDVNQAPGRIAEQGAAAVNAGVAHVIEEAKKFANDPFGLKSKGQDALDRLRRIAGEWIGDVLFWGAIAAAFLLIVPALVSSLVIGLMVRGRLKAPKRA